jgi:hypothetical protein
MMMKLATAAGLLALALAFQDPQDGFEYRYQRGGVVLDLLADDLQSRFGWTLSDCSLVADGDTLILRTRKKLTEEEKRTLDAVIAAQPDYRQNPELMKPEAVRKRLQDRKMGPWRKRFAECRSEAERVQVIAEYLELTGK